MESSILILYFAPELCGCSSPQLHDDRFPSGENRENTSEAFNNADKRATLPLRKGATEK